MARNSNGKTPVNVVEDNTWEELVDESKRTLLAFFKAGAADSLAIGKARVATAVLSSFTRHEATFSAREGTAVVIARTIANNPQEFAAYLNASMPHLKVPVTPLAIEQPVGAP